MRDVSLDIRAGMTVAIVGRSGSGKSTLARLLAGLYRPTEGRVLFDGHDLVRLELKSLRRQIGMVPQQPSLFAGSIRGNIALADPTRRSSASSRPPARAAVHDDIRAMPMGYDTLLADGGASLSGGQRQRIALARALVHHPAILILDEATSALDAETERRVIQNLERAALHAHRHRAPAEHDRQRRPDPRDGRAARSSRAARTASCWRAASTTPPGRRPAPDRAGASGRVA